jgi:hypothetical protein
MIGASKQNEIRPTPGLGEALFKSDTARICSILTNTKPGDTIHTWGMELLVDSPTPAESDLIQTSMSKQQEQAIVQVGEHQKVIAGKRGEISESEVFDAINELSIYPGERIFSHTHWEPVTTPLPSGPDIPVFQQLTKQFGFKCRVISWLPGGKTFEYVGEYKI